MTAGADRVVVLQDGRVAEQGAPAALAPDGPFAALRRDEVAVAA